MSKKEIVIWGAGLIGQRLCIDISKKDYEHVVFFVDSNPSLWNTKIRINDIEYDIYPPEKLVAEKYDEICIAVKNAANEIYIQCTVEMEIPGTIINREFLDNFTNDVAQQYLQCRDWFVEDFAGMGISGSVAEVGVFRGAFAKVINRCFPDRKLYLYDTFQGFNENDIKKEILLSGDESAIKQWQSSMGNFSNTSVDYVLSQMPYPGNCIIKKGYFPETFSEYDEKFAFVNLDCDLYNPIKAGLEQFYPRMEKGGIILIHEYFDDVSFLPGIKQAVNEFVFENNCVKAPIGDKQSIAIIKK